MKYVVETNVTRWLDNPHSSIDAKIEGMWVRNGGCGGRDDSPRMVYFDRFALTVEELQGKIDRGDAEIFVIEYTCTREDDSCEGDAEPRWIGNKSRILCEKHQRDSLAVWERAQEYMTVTPAEWFDESYAGERWDEDEF